MVYMLGVGVAFGMSRVRGMFVVDLWRYVAHSPGRFPVVDS